MLLTHYFGNTHHFRNTKHYGILISEVIMSKSYLITHRKYMLKATIITMALLLGQSAMAACPDPRGINIEGTVVGTSGGQDIYFCKQEFKTGLVFRPTEEDLLTGGSQAISQGNIIQTAPLSNSSVNLAGFNVANLAFNTLSADFPDRNGTLGTKSLFNFYTRIFDLSNCNGSLFVGNQYNLMRNYLRANPNIFQTIPATGSNSTQNTGNSIAKITDAKLKSDIDTTKELTADILVYESNTNNRGDFSTGFLGSRYCWLGTGTTVTINPNNGSLKYAGDYKLGIGVNTQ